MNEQKFLANINLIDRPSAIKYISELIVNELERNQISEQRLGWMMGGLSQGTINKLRQGKFNNIPDFDTLEAIALYLGMSLSKFIAQLEKECFKPLTQKQSEKQLLSAIYQVEDVTTLAEVAAAANSLLKVKLLQAREKD